MAKKRNDVRKGVRCPVETTLDTIGGRSKVRGEQKRKRDAGRRDAAREWREQKSDRRAEAERRRRSTEPSSSTRERLQETRTATNVRTVDTRFVAASSSAWKAVRA